MTEQAIQHHAEELGESRAYAKNEAVGLFVAATIAGLWAGLGVLAVGAGYYLATEYSPMTAFYVLALPGGALLGGGVVLVRGLHEQIDGLRSWREATTYYPPMPAEPAQLPSPPIVVKPYGGDPYVLQGDEPLALPDGRQSGLSLNEPTIAAILKEVITHHDGNWSRKRLMGLRIQGQRITRAFYEELTAKLAHAGFLQERRIGGYKVPEDIQQFDDLTRYFPNLEGGKAGRQAGRRERGGNEGGVPPASRGYNLAERHRLARMEDLDHSVRCYLEKKGLPDD